MGKLVQHSGFKPRAIPLNGDVSWVEIDRAQTLDPDVDLAREKIEELGRDGIIDWLKDNPVVGCRLTQHEYGSMEFFNILANQSISSQTVTLSNFEDSAVDLLAGIEGTDETHAGTLWFPKQRLTGFTLNIGDPSAIVSRSFEWTGDDAILWQNNNKYLIFKKTTVSSGDLGSGNSYDITVSDPTATQDPDDSDYIKRVVRVRSGTSTELTSGTDYSYTTGTLTITSAQIGDVYKYWYTASSYISGQSVFSNNDSDLAAIRAHSVQLYLYVGSESRVYKVQSANLDVRLDRGDVNEIGNTEAVLRSVDDSTVTVTLGKLIDTDFSVEEVLANQADGYGKIDAREFSDDAIFVAKIYESSDQSNFKIGYKMTGLSPTSWRPGTGNINAQADGNTVLECENLTVTSDSSSL